MKLNGMVKIKMVFKLEMGTISIKYGQKTIRLYLKEQASY